MKRFYQNRLLLLFFFFNVSSAFYLAGANCGLGALSTAWRWRNNNGSETSATWKAAQQTAIFYSNGGGILRLRTAAGNNRRQPNTPQGECSVSAPYISSSINSYLQYSTTPSDAASWVTITSSSTNAFMMASSASSYVLQNEPTTQQLSSNSQTFYPGVIMTTAAALSYSFPGNSISEFEWVIMGTNNMQSGTTYHFRQTAMTIFPASTNPIVIIYPSLTTVAASSLPVRLTRFYAKKEGGKVRVEWTTASEENSDYFEVQRSADGQAWQTITQVQSQGNTSNTTDYFIYDERPLPALNYYRLKQVDKDGRFSLSEIRSLRLLSDGVVSVWPNPASSFINFSLKDAETKVTATLQDATGRQVQRQVFNNLLPGAVSQLAMVQKPPAGVYILKLESDGFSETRKIIIQ